MLSHVLQLVVYRNVQTGCPMDMELVILHLMSAIHNIPVVGFPVLVMSLLLGNVVSIVL